MVRYPAGAEPVTGFAHEPWHLRYVGTATATSLKNSGSATVESYMGLPRAPRY